MDLVAMLMGGLLGSGHCVGMCGGFVVTIGASSRRFSPALVRQLVYSAGRMFTYGFLGALAGLVGARLATLNLPLVGAQRALSLVAGVAMLGVGLSNLGVIRFRRRQKNSDGCLGPGGALLGHFLNGRGYGASFLAGVFTGFLPCGLVYTFLALAMSSGDPLRGWLGMVCFGLGTVPTMVALGCGGAMLGQMARFRVHQLASCFVILLGCATVWRSLPHEQACCDSCAKATPAAAEVGP